MAGEPHQKTNDPAPQRLQCLMGSAPATIPDTAQRFAQTFASHFSAWYCCRPQAVRASECWRQIAAFTSPARRAL